MGLKLETLQHVDGISFSSKGMNGTVNSHDSQRSIRVSWENPDHKNDVMSGGDPYLFWSEVFKNTNSETLVLPQVFTSLEDLKDRRLNINFQIGPQSLEIFSQKIFGLQVFGLLLEPQIRTRVRSKVWNDSPHGINSKHRFTWIENPYVGIKHLNAANNNPNILNRVGKLTAALSWDIEVSDGHSKRELIIPIADLEVPYNDHERLSRVAQNLAKHGFSGHLIRSGDFTHYMGDFLLPKIVSAQLVGKLMSILTPQNDDEAQSYAYQLSVARDARARRIASQNILSRYPSDTPHPSELDVRWAGHIFAHNKGHAGLRCLDAKGYGFNPYEIGRIS